MDCILHAEREFARFDGYPISAAFHLAEIERALQFIQANLTENTKDSELLAACREALEAVHILNAGQTT